MLKDIPVINDYADFIILEKFNFNNTNLFSILRKCIEDQNQIFKYRVEKHHINELHKKYIYGCLY